MTVPYLLFEMPRNFNESFSENFMLSNFHKILLLYTHIGGVVSVMGAVGVLSPRFF